MAPFDLIFILGKFWTYAIFLLIGMGFGSVLEMSGFGDSRILSSQFYLRDMTVLKVMFTSIVVAMVLLFTFSSLGMLDLERVFVNPTYLLPGIVGGLIMGAGFIVGGFCPGTSLAAAATLKLDGMFFVGGVFLGVALFGETHFLIDGFFNSTYMGRFTLPELLGLPPGLVVFMIVVMALVMFFWAEVSELIFGKGKLWKDISLVPSDSRKIFGSALLVFAALFLIFAGQPDHEQRWNWIEQQENLKLQKREVYIHPGELLETMNDQMVYTRIIDVRSEEDFNLFHLKDAYRMPAAELRERKTLKWFLEAPDNTVIVLLSNGETASTEAYMILKAMGVSNVYILERGINNWLAYFPLPHEAAQKIPGVLPDRESLAYRFFYALGARNPAANPVIDEEQGVKFPAFIKKIKIQKKKVVTAGCS